jgi:peptidoglycan/LPS O-acetylase OafA/YrhL
VDGLRGIAILLVLFFHYVTSIPAPRYQLWQFLTTSSRLFWSGVDLFFVLSGFLIAGILVDSRGSARFFRTFYLRRFHRIFPLYFGWLALFYLGNYLDLDSKLGAEIFRTPVPLWLYPLFLQNNASLWFNATDLPWMAMSWSLAIEEQFYVFLPCLVRFMRRTGLVILSTTVIVLSPACRVLLAKSYPERAWEFSSLSRLDALAMGVLVALLVRDESWWSSLLDRVAVVRWACFLLLLGCICLTYLSITRLRGSIRLHLSIGVLLRGTAACAGRRVSAALLVSEGRFPEIFWQGFLRRLHLSSGHSRPGLCVVAEIPDRGRRHSRNFRDYAGCVIHAAACGGVVADDREQAHQPRTRPIQILTTGQSNQIRHHPAQFEYESEFAGAGLTIHGPCFTVLTFGERLLRSVRSSNRRPETLP